MKAYLACAWVDKDYAATVKQLFIREGHTVVSTWTEQHDTLIAEQLRNHALADYRELLSADTLILLATAKSAGKETEFGIALALGKRVILVGSRAGNIFRHLPQVEVFHTVADVLDKLEAERTTVNPLA